MSLTLPWRTIGHERQKQELEDNLKEKNLAHAYLFSGPEHIGKLHLAKEMAHALLCEKNMCRTCKACRQIENLTHPDFLILDMLYIKGVQESWEEIAKHSNTPQSHRASGTGVKSNTIGIGGIRAIQKLLQEKPLGKYKICIISNIERLNIEAANAFLKSVEEPPKGTIFLFTSSRESQILPTLISRVRMIRFNLLHDDLILKQLTSSTSNEILEYAQGRIGIAMELDKNLEKFQKVKSSYSNIHEVFHSMNTVKRFALAAKLSENIEELYNFIEHSLFYLRSQLHSKNKKVAKLIEKLEETQELIGKNVNKRLALENFFLEIDNLN
ncbi:hypothetical protein HON22_06070 [Candidatus Peregrinibacteria bacterium]|jgi:DNA polymerase III delta prime subunit|nr:hypothetical protein [Candidatus Peregrinibacteria bacterium]